VEILENSMSETKATRRFRRWTILTLAGALTVTAAVGGAIGWHGRQPARRFARALAAADAQRFDEVRRELAALENVSGYAPQYHFLRGTLLLEEQQFYPALDEFGHAVDVPELRLRTLILSGEALYRVQAYRAAVGLLVQAVDLQPEAVGGHRWLAAAYYDLGLTDDAMRHLGRVAELDPADPRPHRLMGLMHKDFENYAAAIDSYRESLRRSREQPDRETMLRELAECQLKLRQHREALETLVECGPAPDRWALEAEGRYGLGEVAEARRLLDQTLRAAPANLPALLLLGTIVLEGGDAKAAVEVLSQAATAYPKDYTVRFKLERAYRRLGDTQRADQQARIAAEMKRLREQFSKLHETAAAEPNNADVRCQLGILAGRMDRPDLARVWFQAALAIDPEHQETRRQVSGRGK
jgi:tetratricopeptide (TPR) repeat protein